MIDGELVQDVCLSSPRVALEFYRAARDAMLLYEAVIPVKVSAWDVVLKHEIYLLNCMQYCSCGWLSYYVQKTVI